MQKILVLTMQSLFLIRFQAMARLSLKEFMQIGQMNSQKIGKIILVNILLRLYNALLASKKNSSDMYLTTDIAEILYEKNIDIFVIVSSDSDYTSWVQKIREKGKQALGFGELKTIKSYVNSFNEFFYLNVKEKDERLNKELVDDLNVIVDNLIEEKGIAEYTQISIGIRRKYADFIPSNYGCKRFKELIDKYLSITTNKYKKNIKDDNKSYYLSEEK